MRFPLGVLLGPGIDIAAYLLAAGLWGVSPEHAQILSFVAAVGFAYLPWLRSHPDLEARGWTAGLALHLAVVTLLAFFVRSGVLFALSGASGWQGHAATATVATATAAIAMAAIAASFMMYAGFGYCASHREWRLGGGAGWRTGAVGIIVAGAALRLVYSGQVELLPEETYYWNYARHLDIGYLDHPPMVAWLIGAGTSVFGSSEFGVRVGALCTGAVATFFTYRLTENLFGRPSALAAAVLMQTLPFFFLAGMLMTPDAPLTAAWAASLYFLERALVAGRREAWWGAGVCLGLGLLSKYTVALVALSALIFALVDPQARRWLRRPVPLRCRDAGARGVLAGDRLECPPRVGVLSFSDVASAGGPAAVRAAQAHRIRDRLVDPDGAHGRCGGVCAGRTRARLRAGRGGASSTWLAIPPGGDTPRRWRYSWCSVCRREVKLDWTGAPWVAVVPLLACGIVDSARGVAAGFRAFLRRSWMPTLVVLLLIYGAGLYDLTWGIPGVGYGRHAELIPIGWRELGGQIDAIAERIGKETGRPPLVVGMDRYAIASELAYYAPDRTEGVGRTSSGHLFGQVGLMYERWFPPADERGRDLLLVAWNRADLMSDPVSAAVERLGPVEEGVLTRGDGFIRRYYYRVGYGYRGAEPRAAAAD